MTETSEVTAALAQLRHTATVFGDDNPPLAESLRTYADDFERRNPKDAEVPRG